jgi:hypothetical protein
MGPEISTDASFRRVTTDEHGSWYYHEMDAPTSLSTSIVLAVSDVVGKDVEDLSPPLHELINPDGVDRVFDTPDRTGTVGAASLRIHIWGRDVTIFNDGWILVSPESGAQRTGVPDNPRR